MQLSIPAGPDMWTRRASLGPWSGHIACPTPLSLQIQKGHIGRAGWARGAGIDSVLWGAANGAVDRGEEGLPSSKKRD